MGITPSRYSTSGDSDSMSRAGSLPLSASGATKKQRRFSLEMLRRPATVDDSDLGRVQTVNTEDHPAASLGATNYCYDDASVSPGYSRSSAKGHARFARLLERAGLRRAHRDDEDVDRLPRYYRFRTQIPDQNRMDQEHYLTQALLGTNHLAPIEDPDVILDVGTGTGTWVLEMAYEFPDAQVIGIDALKIAPTTVIPQNCSFQVMDILKGLRFPDCSIDYIHHRYVVGIPKDGWPNYIRDCVRILRKNSWLEILETDCLLYRTGPHGDRFNKVMLEFMDKVGVRITDVQRIGEFMVEHGGLVDVETYSYEVSLIPPEGERANWNMANESSPKLSERKESVASEASELDINAQKTTRKTSVDSGVCSSPGTARREPIHGLRWPVFRHIMRSLTVDIKRECGISPEEWHQIIDNVKDEAWELDTYWLHLVTIGRKAG